MQFCITMPEKDKHIDSCIFKMSLLFIPLELAFVFFLQPTVAYLLKSYFNPCFIKKKKQNKKQTKNYEDLLEVT